VITTVTGEGADAVAPLLPADSAAGAATATGVAELSVAAGVLPAVSVVAHRSRAGVVVGVDGVAAAGSGYGRSDGEKNLLNAPSAVGDDWPAAG
jgi:hypothetical protein